MERESNPMEALCRSGCGFYGNPSTDGLCSVCFKEALKKKQQPPATTPSPVSAPFVPAAPAPAPAPTPLAAATPTVPSLPVQPLQHTDAQQAREESLNESKCPTGNIQKLTIMENDPNKKDSKGKRLFKKASRRNSKTSNGSQQSLEQGISVSRSKSFEIKHGTLEINDSTPLPTPEGTTDKSEHDEPKQKLKTDKTHSQNALTILDVNRKKILDIQEERNEVYEETDTVSRKGSKSSSLKLDKNNEQSLEPGSSKRGVKRKLEEESGAGTSGTSTGASDTDADDKDPSKDKKKKNRCAVCRKKVGLTGFECRCGGLFCAVHRYSDKHECSFDYRELGAQEIRRNNPVVVSQKIHKI